MYPWLNAHRNTKYTYRNTFLPKIGGVVVTFFITILDPLLDLAFHIPKSILKNIMHNLLSFNNFKYVIQSVQISNPQRMHKQRGLSTSIGGHTSREGPRSKRGYTSNVGRTSWGEHIQKGMHIHRGAHYLRETHILWETHILRGINIHISHIMSGKHIQKF